MTGNPMVDLFLERYNDDDEADRLQRMIHRALERGDPGLAELLLAASRNPLIEASLRGGILQLLAEARIPALYQRVQHACSDALKLRDLEGVEELVFSAVAAASILPQEHRLPLVEDVCLVLQDSRLTATHQAAQSFLDYTQVVICRHTDSPTLWGDSQD